MAGVPPTRRRHQITFFEVLWLVAVIAGAVFMFRLTHARTGSVPVALIGMAVGFVVTYLVFMLCLLGLSLCVIRTGNILRSSRTGPATLDPTQIPRGDMPPGGQRPDPRFRPRPDR